MANVVFLWHMHQPYYVNPATQTAMMPWVRLHSVKGYLDMISVIEEFPTICVNFNLTPVLILQIKELIDGKIRDLWLDWSRKPAADLTEHDKFTLLENFFKIHWDHLIKPFPRYWELLNKRGLTFYRDEVRRNLRYFTTQEFLDLQTWFNLAWCGYTADRLYPELAALKKKGRNFTEQEKNRVLDIHLEIMRLVLEKYRAAEERGQVELTTTPFFHPILPLIYDSAFAERSLPGREFPARFNYPEDAAAHLTLAVEQHAAIFGKAPRGLWPSEGSIAPELIPLMERCGIEYFCSDEENLFNSLKSEPAYRGVGVDHLELFQGWRVTHAGASVNALFREKPLSDFIGFTAAKNGPHQAAGHLLNHLRNIAGLVPAGDGVIPLILDGENAWETFPDGGESFLRALYGGIAAEPTALHSCTMEDYFRAHPPKKKITTLHTGSWISSNFDIWIGDPEENRAWDLLGQTRALLQRSLENHTLTPAQECAAKREIYAAEGSDWFWWYGPDFSTDNDGLFDELFRQHLQNVHTLCGAPIPPELERPITSARTAPLDHRPERAITPAIDGRRPAFFDWLGAGTYLPGSESAAMHRSARHLSRITFGNDARALSLLLEVREWSAFSLQITFSEPPGFILKSAPLTRTGPQNYTLTPPAADVSEKVPTAIPVIRDTLAVGEVIQLSILLTDLGLTPGATVAFQIRLFEHGLERECYPEAVPLQFPLLSEEHALANWIV